MKNDGILKKRSIFASETPLYVWWRLPYKQFIELLTLNFYEL